MNYRSSRKQPRIGALLFLIILVILLAVIAVQLLALSKRDSKPAGESSETTSGSSLPENSSESEPEESQSDLDPNRIIMDFSTIIAASGDDYLQRWPSDSSVEQLRDSSALIASLKGRPFGPDALKGVTVILDPGHGGIDGGTAFPINPPHQIVEKDIVLPLAMKTKANLEALGAEVIMTRTTDEFISVYARAAKAGEVIIDKLIDELSATEKTLDPLYEFKPLFERIYELNKDVGGGEFLGGAGTGEKARLLYDLGRQFPEVIFLSLHNNSFADDPNIGGLQVFYVDNAFQYAFTKTQAGRGDNPPPVYQGFDDENRLRFATGFSKAILKDIPELVTVGGPETMKQDGFVVLNRTGLASVMLELGYVTNANDRANLLDPAFRDRLADSITRGIYDYYSAP